MTLDMTKLEPLLGTMVNELGAAANAALVLIGDKLGLLPRAWRRAPRDVRPSWPRRPARTSATCANGWRRRPRPASSTYDAPRGDVRAVARAGGGVRRRGQPRQHDRRLPFARRRLRRRAEARAGLQDRQGRRLGRPLQLPVLRRRALLPAGLQGAPGRRVAARARRRRARSSSAARKVADVGCGHGASTMIMAEAFPNSRVRRHRLPRRRRSRTRGSMPRACRNVRFETARAQDYRRLGLRPRHHVRCAARHGRSGRRGGACPRDAEARRHADAGRADGRRQPRGQSQPGRARLLRLLDHASACRPRSTRRSARRSARRPARSACARWCGRAASPRFRRAAETPFNMVLEARP